MRLFSLKSDNKRLFCLLLALIAIYSVAFSGCRQTQKRAPSGVVVETTKKRGSAARGTSKDYIECDVIALFEILNVNVLKARSTYKNAYVKVDGYVVSVEKDGNYLTIGAKSDNYEHILSSMRCNVLDDVNRARLPGLTKDDHVTIKGQIVSVNEFLGYTLNVESIVLSAPRSESTTEPEATVAPE